MPIDRASVLRNAENLVRLGRLDAALAEYRRVVEEQPQDWNTANTLGDLYQRCGQTDRAVEQFARIADALNTQGFLARAAAVYKKILKIRPGDEHAMLQVGEIAASQGVLVDARAFFCSVADQRAARGDHVGASAVRKRLFEAYLRAGDLERAREFAGSGDLRASLGQALIARGDVTAAARLLAADSADADPQALLTFAHHALVAGAVEEGLMTLRRLLHRDASQDSAVAHVGWGLAASAPDLALRVVEIVAESAVLDEDWRRAAAALEKFITLAPDHVPALRRLVRICVDGGLEATRTLAETRLADACLATGAAAEARTIVEQLLAREPGLPLHVDRLRRALTMLGEPDAERVIAKHVVVALEEFQSVETGEPEDGSQPPSALEMPSAGAEPFAARPTGAPPQDGAEVDLSDMLADLAGVDSEEASPRGDLEEVFGQLREQALRAAPDDARAAYQRGVELRDSDLFAESISAFEVACRDPVWRFRAASAIARMYQESQQMPQAVEWLERAVEAQAPDPEEANERFYDLADALESIGETERALAVCLELQAEAGDYRDVADRIKRLTGVRA